MRQVERHAMRGFGAVGAMAAELLLCLAAHAATFDTVIYHDGGADAVLYANALRTMLWHMDAQSTLVDVDGYATNTPLAEFDAGFYIGSHYRGGGEALPNVFLSAVATNLHPFCWFNYNIWQLTWSPYWSGRTLTYDEIRGSFNYNRVSYKGRELIRNDNYQEIVAMQAGSNCLVRAEIHRSSGDPMARPYATSESNFWYIADNPFVYDGAISRTVAVADMLHDILGTGAKTNHQALVRIEDVAPGNADPQKVLAIWEAATNQNVYPSFGVIPRFINADGSVDITLSQTPELVSVLRHIADNGGTLLCHGYTHRNDEEAEPTGNGFEFWNDGANRPLLYDNYAYAEGRVRDSFTEMARAGLPVFIWETPHYEASLIDYVAIGDGGMATYERMRVFGADIDGLSIAELETLSGQGLPSLTQYLPFPVMNSPWGTPILPENMEYYSPGTLDGNGLPMDVASKRLYAESLLCVRDGVASFFYHHFLDPGPLVDIITNLQAVGYTFTTPRELLQAGDDVFLNVRSVGNGTTHTNGLFQYATGTLARVDFSPDTFYDPGLLQVGTNTLTGAPTYWETNLTHDLSLYVEYTPRLTGQGTPEYWLAEHGFTNDFETASQGDQDGDGMATWEEFVAAVDPTNRASLLQAEAKYTTNGLYQLDWYPVTTGRVYTVYHSDQSPSGLVPIATNATPPFVMLAPTNGQAFMTIRVSLPGE